MTKIQTRCLSLTWVSRWRGVVENSLWATKKAMGKTRQEKEIPRLTKSASRSRKKKEGGKEGRREGGREGCREGGREGGRETSKGKKTNISFRIIRRIQIFLCRHGQLKESL